jgi:hypothetical protein
MTDVRDDIAAEDAQPVKSYVSALGILVCFGAFGAATVWDMFDGPEELRQEWEAPTPTFAPTLSAIKALPGTVRQYLRKRYAYKAEFIQIDSAIKSGLFGHIPAPNSMKGRDGFWFIDDRIAMANVQGVDHPPFDTDEAWQGFFEDAQAEMDARDIDFVFILAPNKHTVHRDKLPEWLDDTYAGNIRTDRLLATANATLKNEVTDLRVVFADMIADDPTVPLYYKTDTHWTELGGALGVQAALSPVFGDLPDPQVTDMQSRNGGDLVRMAGLETSIQEEVPSVRTAADTVCYDEKGDRFEIETIDPLPVIKYRCETPSAPYGRIMVFHDSFGVPAAPAVVALFRESFFYRTFDLDLAAVDLVQPDVVMKVFAERRVHFSDPAKMLLPSEDR